jgi:hypothetical protein
MTVTMIRGTEVNRPEPDALTSSVLDHATVVDNEHFGIRNNFGLWPSYNCLDLLIPTPMCPQPLATQSKSFVGAGWVPGFEFAVYGGVQCNALGLDTADQDREVKRVFGRSEGKGVEQALLLNRFVATDGSDPVPWSAPVDLGTAPTLLSAIGKMEGYAAAKYAGIPTLHLPRAVITMGFGQGAFEKKNGLFFTKAGSKVAAGGGYDDATPPQSATMDLFVTGEVYVERSEAVNISSYVAPHDGTLNLPTGTATRPQENAYITLAERMYRVGIDCLLAKVTATVWS